ncbi:MAG: glycosyltransferase [Pseudomonadota bacterium]
MLAVTHLLGTGHLARALLLAKAFQSAGHQTHLVSGGMPAPHLQDDGIKITQLPPLRADGADFANLRDMNGDIASAELFDRRCRMLCDVIDAFQPDVLITELFPFGRRSLKAEHIALLKRAAATRPKPLILSSIRDILAPPSKQRKIEFADDMVNQFYDGVLCHADPSVMTLDKSWPISDQWRHKLSYTGFVTASDSEKMPAYGAGDIIVSAGGGDVGAHLFTAAIEAAKSDEGHTWRLLIGGSKSDQAISALQKKASVNVTVEHARPDFPAILRQARCSISLCGYNTALDVLRAGCPAIFVPFDAGNEVEQSIRATALEAKTGIDVIKAADLTKATLLEKVRAVIAAPARAPMKNGTDGAQKTVEIAERMLRAAREN